jgi:hypothetical protein
MLVQNEEINEPNNQGGVPDDYSGPTANWNPENARVQIRQMSYELTT